jgi:uncharacterized protein (DUF885 family)
MIEYGNRYTVPAKNPAAWGTYMRIALKCAGIMCRLTVAAIVLSACARPATPGERFHDLLDAHWENAVAEQVFFRSDPDAWRMNGKLAEFTAEARARRQTFNNEILARLEEIDIESLDKNDQVSYRVFEYERLTERDSYEYYDHLFPFTSMFGYHTYFAEAPAAMSFLSAADYEKYLISLADFPRYNNEHIDLLREAVSKGFTHYCESLAGYEETIRAHIVDDAKASALFVPFLKFPATMSAEQQADFTARGIKLIESGVIPGYQALLAFFQSEYMPACRENVGITSLDGGLPYYEYLIRYFTTTDLSPEEIHNLGLSEVRRIRGEMQEIIDRVEFDGDFTAFLEYLRSEPSFYANSVSELLGKAALICKTAEGETPKFFSRLPRGTYNIKASPVRGTFYMPSSGDGTTAGTYFLGTEQLDSQPLYTLESLSLHEAVPGHHLQSALATELGLPEFRRQLYHAGYGEGWALYAEFLGKEMGFYQDPYSDFGRLTYEAWRAGRLVVDTGLHVFGWSRQEAIDYMLSISAMSELEVSREIDRYITWPGQALAYKIGELKIKELRKKAESALGENFEIRAFHDTVVGNGSVPIAVLEDIVNEWIDAQE